MATYNPNHFCPSWLPCCEANLALQPTASQPTGLTILTPDNFDDSSTPPTPCADEPEVEEYNPLACITCNQGPLTPRFDGIHAIICAGCRPN